MKRLAILGSTGSIGRQTLDVVRALPNEFKISVLVANKNDELFEKQLREFQPSLAVLHDEEACQRLKNRITDLKIKIFSGDEGLIKAATFDEVDMVVTSLVGFAGLAPTLAALDAGKDIALANKETLVVAGELVMKKAKQIFPIDSEHGAIWQCLRGNTHESIEKIILTASGGPFRGKKRIDLEKVSVKDCLAHPTWSMGKKITIDSASLVNKGLEVIEAHWLYDVPYEKIEVVVHPQSVVHSMVQYRDGSIMAQLGVPDMRLPIQYALTYPTRHTSPWERLDFSKISALTFEKPDCETFLGLKLAYRAGKIGGTMPCVLNAANEIAVEKFLAGKISFLKIYALIEKTMQAHEKILVTKNLSLKLLQEVDAWARDFAQKI